MSHLSFENLRCFLAAAEQLNFRRAAGVVALTPAAFSQRIKQLEDHLGVSLFERSSRRVALTAEGQALRPSARQALAALSRCSDLRPGIAHFTLGTRFELGTSWLTPAVIALEPEPQRWRVELVFGNGEEIVARLERGTVDAIVTSSPVVRDDWSAEVLHPECYAFVGTPDLVDTLPLNKLEDSQRHQLLDIDANLPLARYLLSASPGIEFSRTRCCGTGAAVRAFALAGLGVAVLPNYMVAADIEAGRFVRLLPEVELLRDSFRLMYRKDSSMCEQLADFAAYLRSRPLT